jgi:ABC-type lipoprotein release transport system permease subunit
VVQPEPVSSNVLRFRLIKESMLLSFIGIALGVVSILVAVHYGESRKRSG